MELDISVDNEEIEAAFLQVLSFPELELAIQCTLYKAGVTQPVSLTLLITDDAAIQELNKHYRQQDKPTDVLSFPLLDKPLVNAPGNQLWIGGAADQSPDRSEHLHEIRGTFPAFVTPSELPMHLGDIVISWPTVVRQASDGDHSPAYELLYLLAHGVLHLIGYDDQTEAGYSAMVDLQESVLRAVGRKAQSI